MFVTLEHHFSEPFLVSIFALFVSFSTECFTLLLVLRTILDCAPISMFVSIRSTSSLLCVGAFLILVTSLPRLFGFNAVSAWCCCSSLQVNSSPSEPCSWSLQLVSLRLESPRTSSRVSIALPRQLLHVVLCVLGYITLLRKIRVVLSLRCCLSLLCDLFEIDLVKLDDLLGVLC